MRVRGRVATVVADRGFFFVRAEDPSDVKEYFAHRSQLLSKQFHLLHEGQPVSFVPQMVPNKGWQAWDVREEETCASVC